MMQTAQGAGLYEVSVEHGTLQRIPSDRGDARYRLQLNGEIDDRWAEAYRLERRESRASARFELDLAAGSVWFASLPGGDSADIIDALDLLDALVKRVNQRASRLGQTDH